MFVLRAFLGSIFIFAFISWTVFGTSWIIYESEWRLEQVNIQKRFTAELKWEHSRTSMSQQVSKVLRSQNLPRAEIEEIIVKYVDTYYPNSKAVQPFFSDATYWTYSTSIWFVICQIMSLQPINELEIFSVVTHLFTLYNKLFGPTAAILSIASMSVTVNWFFTIILPCVLRKPSDLSECLTAAYQKCLLARDLIVMALSLCYFAGVTVLCVFLYSTHSNVDMVTSLSEVFAMMSLTAVSAKEIYSYESRDSIMEVLYWTCLLLLVNSALGAGIASIIRAYHTWINAEEVVATPKELLRNLEKEKKERKNQLVYHPKSE
ncbi:hypothetical protein ANCCAN_14581 [Ancylostoma caninum]|uniref:Uncharacterized protein n=1 Tax=Ancylostoma caninum TaxID=29170 RepID=A0A368G4U5_ANCCA|nr:hypothetical protein ANCCAN_14581 [Ancylostoma caninum]